MEVATAVMQFFCTAYGVATQLRARLLARARLSLSAIRVWRIGHIRRSCISVGDCATGRPPGRPKPSMRYEGGEFGVGKPELVGR